MAEQIFDRLPPETGLFMQVWADTFLTELEQSLGDITDQLTEIRAVQRRDSISGSFTKPSNVLSAADAGADVTITIIGHDRFYGDETSLTVAGGSLTGLAFSTTYGVYYDDSTRADTTPTYHATVDLETAQNNYVAGRHLVGSVETPANGDPPTEGGTAPPGSGYTPGGGGGIVIP